MTGGSGAGGPAVTDAQLEELLVFIREVRGPDLTGYKRTTLRRRLAKRMHDAGAADVLSYRDRLETDPGEFTALFDTVLINVTSFLRDPSHWEYLRAEVIPAIVARCEGGDGSIRVWTAGCASGQEAYSLAMSFADLLGEVEYDRRLKIYGTDVDEAALSQARTGLYSAEQLQPVPDRWRERYFTVQGDGFVVSRGLRHRVIFGRHDLTVDAPISRVDLIACRNTLMYFNAEVQSLIVDRLHFGLRPEGVLFLGRAEMLLTGDRFTSVNVQARVFRRSTTGTDPRPAAPGRAGTGVPAGHAGPAGLVWGAVDGAPDAMLMVDADGALALANQAARTAFDLSEQDVGRPFRHLRLPCRAAQLRTAVDQAAVDGLADLAGLEVAGEDGDERLFDVRVRPVRCGQEYLGASVTFTDVTQARRMAQELKRHRVDLETTQEQLRGANQELETANEELQSMNEELETTNEELQSTNEELETTNEELQSTNEELETMNEEVQLRGAEVAEYSDYLQGVLASMTAGVAVLDGGFRVRYWNRAAEHMWGLRSDEVVGQPFFDLDFGLPTDGLRDLVEAGLRGTVGAPVPVEAVNRLGRTVHCSVRATPLQGNGHGVVLVIEQAPPAGPGRDAPLR